MEIDDALRAAQHRQRAQASADERARAEIELKRSAYHEEEATVAAKITAIFRRAQQLLDAHSKWEPIQVYAYSRFARGRAHFDGCIIPLPHSYPLTEFALLATGHIATIQRSVQPRYASDMPTIEQWSTSQAQNARSNAQTERGGQSLYKQAFDGRFPSAQTLGQMQAQLASAQRSMQDVVALMLSSAGIRL